MLKLTRKRVLALGGAVVAVLAAWLALDPESADALQTLVLAVTDALYPAVEEAQ